MNRIVCLVLMLVAVSLANTHPREKRQFEDSTPKCSSCVGDVAVTLDVDVGNFAVTWPTKLCDGFEWLYGTHEPGEIWIGDSDKVSGYYFADNDNVCKCTFNVEITRGCAEYHTNDFGETRVQNSFFNYDVLPPVPSDEVMINISIKGNEDAVIALSPTKNPEDDAPDDKGIPKIVIGGWDNQRSGVLCNSNEKDWKEFPSSNILSTTTFRDYYVLFYADHIEVGLWDEEPFMREKIDCAVDVKYIGIASGWGGNVDWKFCGYGIY